MKRKIIVPLLFSGALFCAAEPKLELVPGYEVCSIYLSGCEAETEAELQPVLKYRRESDSRWKSVPDALVYLPQEKELRGSLLELSEGTGYRIQLECLIGGQKKSFPGKFRTRTPKVPVAETILLDEKSPMPLRIARSGSPKGWLRYTMKPGTVLDGGERKNFAIFLDKVSYVILDGLTVRGGIRHGINVENCSEIQILNCDISGFGRVGVHRPDLNGMYYNENNKPIDQDAGIRIRNTRAILVERNYVHDPRGTANSWFYAHPAGPNGLNLGNVREAAIRYNDFIGSDLHRWNDASEGANNGAVTGSAWRDAEITGNNFLFANDDGMELDGGQINARFFRNRSEGIFCGVSLAPCLRGPVWCYRNLFCATGAEFGLSNVGIKSIFGGRGSGYGRIYCFNNTIVGLGSGISSFGGNRDAGEMLRFVSRRNLVSVTGVLISNALFKENRVDFDRDLLKSSPGFLSIPAYRKLYGQEKNGIAAAPWFLDEEHGNYRLQPGSPGYRENIGAFTRDDDRELPCRPISLVTSVSRLRFRADSAKEWKPQTVTLSVTKPGSEVPFRIVQNEAFPFLRVSPREGVVRPGTPVTLTVSIDPEQIRTALNHSAAFLVRQPDGFSRCVIVYADSRQDRALLAVDRAEAIAPESITALGDNRWQIDFNLKQEFRGYLFGRFSAATPRKVTLLLNGAKSDRNELRGPAEVRPQPVWRNVGTRNLAANPHFRLPPGKHRFLLTLQKGELLNAALAEQPGTFLNSPWEELDSPGI